MAASSKQLPRIFVLGCPRSGTTLTKEIICAHPDVHRVIPETGLFGPRGLHLLTRNIDKKAYFNMFEEYFWTHIYYDKDEPWLADDYNGISSYRTESYCREAINTFKDRYLTEVDIVSTIRDFIEILFKNDKRTWLEKTPMHCLYINDIRMIYPDAIIVYCTRNRENTISSISSKPWAHKSSSVESHVDHMRYIAEMQLSKKDIIVQLEDVSTDVSPLIGKLNKLGLPRKGNKNMIDFWSANIDPQLVTREYSESIKRLC